MACMDCNIEFQVNSRIEVEDNDEFYKSNIQDIGKDTIGISIPVSGGKYLPLRKGNSLKCIFRYKKQMYSFNTVVVSRKIDRIFIIEIKKPDKVKIFQRRNFVRVPMIVDILCARVSSVNEINHLDSQVEFFNATSIDLSGGGMKISINKKYGNDFTLNDGIMITIPTGDENITVKGKIVRIDKSIGRANVICGVSFVEMNEKSREKIITMVFKIMRELIKKGTKEE